MLLEPRGERVIEVLSAAEAREDRDLVAPAHVHTILRTNCLLVGAVHRQYGRLVRRNAQGYPGLAWHDHRPADVQVRSNWSNDEVSRLGVEDGASRGQ